MLELLADGIAYTAMTPDPLPRVRAAAARYELRFQSLFHAGRAFAFPCDARGEVLWEAMSEGARRGFARARERVGVDLAMPAVTASERA
jgi:hypothetical protein